MPARKAKRDFALTTKKPQHSQEFELCMAALNSLFEAAAKGEYGGEEVLNDLMEKTEEMVDLIRREGVWIPTPTPEELQALFDLSSEP